MTTAHDRMAQDMVMVLLRGVLDEVEGGRLGALIELGLNVDAVKAFRDLTMPELKHLARMRGNWAQFRIDSKKLQASIEHARRQCDLERRAEEMLSLGASAPMMQALWGWSPGETSARKRELGIPAQLGRTTLPSDEVRDDVLVLWRTLSREVPDERERYMRLASETGIRLDALWLLTRNHEVCGATA